MYDNITKMMMKKNITPKGISFSHEKASITSRFGIRNLERIDMNSNLRKYTFICILSMALMMGLHASAREAYTLNVCGVFYYQEALKELEYVNKSRREAGVTPLEMDGKLTQVAMQRAAECAIDFSHQRPDGTDCFSIHPNAYGENIACTSWDISADYVHNVWMNSSIHRYNILNNNFKSIGIGFFQNSKEGAGYAVQIFSYEPATSIVSSIKDQTGTVSVPIVEEQYSVDFDFIQELPKSVPLIIGETYQLDMIRYNPGWRGMYCSIDASSFTWTSSDTSIVTVDQSGLVTARGIGKAYIKISPQINSNGTNAPYLTFEFRVTKDIDKTQSVSHINSSQKKQITDKKVENAKEEYANTSINTTVKKVSSLILSNKTDNDVKDSSYRFLQAKATKTTDNQIILSWNKVKSAKKYIVFATRCGKKQQYKKIATITGKSYIHKKLKKGSYYRYIIVATGSNNRILAISKTIHASTTGGKVCNIKKISVKKDKVSLKVGRKYTINARVSKTNNKLAIKEYRAISYESSNKKVATVTKSGVVKGMNQGKCEIYVYAQNGISKKISIDVKK